MDLNVIPIRWCKIFPTGGLNVEDSPTNRLDRSTSRHEMDFHKEPSSTNENMKERTTNAFATT